MKSLTYIEIDVPVCTRAYGIAPCTASIPTTGPIKCFNTRKTCQDRAHYAGTDVTLRFAKDAAYLPDSVECIPCIDGDVSFTPATISLGENLGTRATLQVVFKDQPHSDTGAGSDPYRNTRGYDPYRQGTFWGKFRARQPYLRGAPIRWITGLLGDDLAEMDIRHFIIESFDGPTPDGKYTLLAKDILKLAAGDRSQAPEMSSGFLVSAITNVAASATLSPTGVGAEYPASGLAVIGGKEVVGYNRSGDVVTFYSRAGLGTAALAHSAQDRFQNVVYYQAADPANIIYDLLVTYAGVPAGFITLSDWQAETAAFNGRLYTGYVCEPTSVETLVSELVQQACLSIWWDEVAQKIRLKVLRGIITDVATFSPENTLQGSLTIKEQPDKRISQVWTYFGMINVTRPLSDTDNYRSTSVVVDETAEDDYQSSVIKKIYSRWIPALGRTVADRLGAIQLGRYRDPPRRLTFDLQRYAGTGAVLGGGYRVEAQSIQDSTGALSNIPVQITRVNSLPDRIKVEAEEAIFVAPDENLTDRVVLIDANINNVSLREAHDSIYPPAASGDTVTCIVNAGVTVGSTSVSVAALDIGSWPSGISIVLQVLGRVQGKGGDGGAGGYNTAFPAGPGAPGGVGGPALRTRYPITLKSSTGQIYAGGGGGGGGGGGYLPYADSVLSCGGGGGGGGRGQAPGSGGGSGQGIQSNGLVGQAATNEAAGVGGTGGVSYGALAGGTGGNGGDAGGGGGFGNNGQSGGPFYPGASGGPGGAAGAAIDGVSYITTIGATGDRRGSQIN